MNSFLVFLVTVGLAAANPQILNLGLGSSQYRIQDEAGNLAFGHVGGPNSREEVRLADGTTRGSYSYVDANGIVQSAIYSADAANGFRIAATDLPVGPAVPATPAVAHVARYAYPAAILGTPVVHALKKRDLVAVSGAPLTSYPGSTAPLVHAVHTPVVAAPVVAAPVVTAPVARVAAPVAVAHPYVASPLYHVLKKRSAVLATPYAFAAPYGIVHASSLNVPADEPAVAYARAAHLIQHNAETLRNHYGAIPLSYPADTPEVSARKVADSIAQANEAVRNVHGLPIAPAVHVLKKRSAVLTPLAYTAPIIPAITVPGEEPSVAHARAAHVAQKNAELLRDHYGFIPLNYPADTPEVSARKVSDTIAQANEAARHAYPYVLY